MCVSRVLLQNLLSQNWRKLGIIFTFLKKKNWGGAFDFFQFCMVNRFFIPRHNGQWPRRIFHPRCYPLHFFPILILEKQPVFPFWCWVPNKGTTGTIFITSLVSLMKFHCIASALPLYYQSVASLFPVYCQSISRLLPDLTTDW